MSHLAASIAVLALAFAFMNGVNDCGALAAPVVSSRCLSPRRAAALAALAALLGAMLLGSAVVRVLGAGLIRVQALPPGDSSSWACATAAAAALCWSLIGWASGRPTSSTHALLGAWLGAFVGRGGLGVVAWAPTGAVLMAVLATPFLGLAASWAAYRLLVAVGQELSPRSLPLFRAAEGWMYLLFCFSNGANAAQRSMALWAVGWGALAAGAVPPYVRLGCALAYASGLLMGSSRTLKTLGFRIFRVGTLHSASALAAAGALVLASTAAGVPLSSGQVVSSSLMGAGAGQNARAVRWGVAAEVLANWALTVPGAALASYFLTKLIQ